MLQSTLNYYILELSNLVHVTFFDERNEKKVMVNIKKNLLSINRIYARLKTVNNFIINKSVHIQIKNRKFQLRSH